MRVNIIAGIILITGQVIFADIHEKAGTESLQFLKVGIGARQVAMGGAGSAGDGNVIFWNPAGMGWIEQAEVNFSHNRWLGDISEQAACYVKPWERMKAGAGVVYFNMGELTGRDNTGERIPNFKAYDMMGVISGAYILKGLSAGVSLKYIREKIEEEKEEVMAMDVGMVYRLRKGLRFSFGVQNTGNKATPMVMRGGVGWDIYDGRMRFNLEAVNPEDNEIQINIGAECRIEKSLYLRAGYYSRMEYGKKITGGIGIYLDRWRIDYVYVPCEYFDDVHEFTVLVKMGKSMEERRREEEIKRKEMELKEKMVALEEERRKIEEERLKLEEERKRRVLPEKRLNELGRVAGIEVEKRIADEGEDIKIKAGEQAVRFSTGSAIIEKDCFEVLDKIAEVLKEFSEYRIEIRVYAETEDIALQRAVNIKDYFILKHEIPERRFVDPYGSFGKETTIEIDLKEVNK